MSTFLVTGGAGFIGAHLVRKLIALGHNVRVLDNLSTGRLENLEGLEGRFEWFCADAAEPDQVDRATTGADGVFHLAAIPSVALSVERPFRNQRSGEVATLAVLDTARRHDVKRVVYSSSCAVYGDTSGKAANEGMSAQPTTFYGLSKAVSEEYCRLFSNLYPKIQTVCLRYFNVFGAHQNPSSSYAGVISIFMRCLRKGLRPTIFGDGRQTRDFIDVRDVVQANLLAMEAQQVFRGDCFNVGTGKNISILELWNYLAFLAGSELRPIFEPARVGEIRNSCADIAKTQGTLHFKAATSWREGLEQLWKAQPDDE